MIQIRRNLLTVAVAAFALAGLSSAQAATTTYSDPSSFNAATSSGSYTESFDSLSLGGGGTSKSFSGNGFSYTATSTFYGGGTDQLYVESNGGTDHYLSTDNSFSTLTFTITGGNVTAIGGDFFTTMQPGAVDNMAVLVSLNDGTLVVLNPSSATSFAGFTSTTPISSIAVFPDPVGAKDPEYATVNNLTVGTSSVPEPSASLALQAAFVLLAGYCGLRHVRVRSAR